MARTAKISVSLTPKQWEDVLTCMRHADGKGLGHVNGRRATLAQANRDRTAESIRKQTNACGYCGSTAGFGPSYEGDWDRCLECKGL